MKSILLFFVSSALLMTSCKIQSNSDNRYESFDKSKAYKVSLNPQPGSVYHYDVTNESNVKTNYNDNKTENINRTFAGITYDVNKDSIGDFVFHIHYDSVHIYTKDAKGNETDIDANSLSSIDPMVKMLGILKAANITAVVSQAGVVKQIDGYSQMTDDMLKGFAKADNYTREVARKRWEQLIDQGIIKKNMDQLFNIFPDSAIHIGDKWKSTSHQNNEIGMDIKSVFSLDAMNSQFTLISSRGDMKNDSSKADLMGFAVTANLIGKQESEYQLETQTGMLLTSKLKASIDGTIQMIGKDVPVSIQTIVTMEGRKVR
jgi:hypothetical protein